MAVHSTHTAPRVEAVEASGPGAIGGFQVACPACGYTFRTSLHSIAMGDALEHVSYMMEKEWREADDDLNKRRLIALRTSR